MTDYTEKALAVLKATNSGHDLPEHQRHIVMVTAMGDLGPASRVVFDNLWVQIEAKAKATPGENR